jgi:uncharacterized protein YpuA (DUF1002 family)
MRFTNQILFIIIILVSIQSYSCQQEQFSSFPHDVFMNYNNTLSSNDTLTIGKLLGASYRRVKIITHLYFLLRIHTFLIGSSSRSWSVHFIF